MLDVRLLVVLRAIAAHGSVTGAARALSYSPSAVSQQLARLERDLGVPLVYRHGRRITMTAHGQDLADRAAALIELADDVEARAARAGRAGDRPRLRIAVFAQAVQWLLAPALAASRDALGDFDDFAIDVTVCAPDAAARDLRHGLADLALVYQPAARRAGSAERTLATVALQLVAADGSYPAARLADCAKLPWVVPTSGSPYADVVERAFADADVSPRVVATATSLDGVAALVGAGLGVSLLPAFAFGSLANAAVVFRTPTDVAAELRVTAQVGRTCAHPELAARLVDEMAGLAGDRSVAAGVDGPAGRLDDEVGRGVGQLDALRSAGVCSG